MESKSSEMVKDVCAACCVTCVVYVVAGVHSPSTHCRPALGTRWRDCMTNTEKIL